MISQRSLWSGYGWHFILADLSLILFLLTLRGFASVADQSPDTEQPSEAVREVTIAPSQAIFRPVRGGPSIAAWLASQSQDDRATLTIFARYAPGGQAEAWHEASRLAREAEQRKVATRMILSQGSDADLYASLAYDSVPADRP